MCETIKYLSIDRVYGHAILYPKKGGRHGARRTEDDGILRKNVENRTKWCKNWGPGQIKAIHYNSKPGTTNDIEDVKKRSLGTINLTKDSLGPVNIIAGLVHFLIPDSTVESGWVDTQNNRTEAWRVHKALRFFTPVHGYVGRQGHTGKTIADLEPLNGGESVLESLNRRLRNEEYEWVQ